MPVVHEYRPIFVEQSPHAASEHAQSSIILGPCAPHDHCYMLLDEPDWSTWTGVLEMALIDSDMPVALVQPLSK